MPETEEETDVKREENLEESSPSEEEPSVEETSEQEEPVSEEQEESTSEETSFPDVGEPSVEALDEDGVPYKNRAMEWKRKYSDTVENLPEMVSEAVENAVGSSQSEEQSRQQRIAELRAFKEENPHYSNQVSNEIQRLEREDQKEMLSSVVDNKFQEYQQQQRQQQQRQQAYQEVSKTYPDVLRSKDGRLEFNRKHPMTQHLAKIMQDERFQKDPEGIRAAADMAYGRWQKQSSTAKNSTSKNKEKELQSEVKDLQKRTQHEGSGSSNQPATSGLDESLERAKKTGRKRDAKKAINDMLKAKGLLKE